MSTINDLIQFADTLQRRKVEDRRYQDQRNMQLAQIAEAKNKENQVIQGQRFFNDMTSGLMKSGWDDEGKWTGEAPNTNKLVETYLANMDSLGLAGDSALALQRVGQFNQLRLQKAGSQLQAKVTDWEANNQGLKGEWYKPFDNTFEKDKKAYLKSINADKLYAQLMGLGGPAAAMETTGLTPDSFGKKADSVSGWDITGGAVGTGLGLFAVKKTVDAMGASIARGEELLTSKGEGEKLLKKLQKELRVLKKGGTEAERAQASKLEKWIKAVNKRGFVDPSAHTVLSKFMSNPDIDSDDAIKAAKESIKNQRKIIKGIDTPTKTSQILKRAKDVFSIEGLKNVGKSSLKTIGKLGAFGVSSMLASNLGEQVGGEKGAKVAEIATGVGSIALFDKAFWKWAGGRLKGAAAKRAAVAGAASLADGPLPIADAIGALVITGMTIKDIISLTTEWDNLSNK